MLKHITSIWNRANRNNINSAIDVLNQLGVRVQDLVAEGQLTEEQYAELLTTINGLLKSGNVDKSDLTPEFKGEIEGFNTQLAQIETKKADKTYVEDKVDELEQKDDSLNTQLAQTEEIRKKENILKNTALKYGRLSLPEDFPRNLPFDIFRNSDGQIHHNHDFDEHTLNSGEVHIKHDLGNENRDGLTPDTAVRFFGTALTIAESLSEETVTIYVHDDVVDYRRFNNVFQHNITKNINIKSISESGRTIYHCAQPPHELVWTSLSDGVYSTNRSNMYTVLDVKYRGEFDSVLEYNKVNDLSECQNKRGSWFNNEDILYVHTLDGREPDTDIICQIHRDVNIRFDISDGKKLTMEGIHWLLRGQTTSNMDAVRISAGSNINNGTEFWAKDCTFSHARNGNGLGTVAIYNTYLFDCRSYGNGRDGFNYHERSIHADVNSLVFEFNCAGYDNGDENESSSNASTAHDGMNIVRVNTQGYDCYGPIIADVNGCYSVLFDCVAGESLLPESHVNNYSYSFNNRLAEKEGKAVLINCSGGTNSTGTIKSEDIDVYVSNIKATLTNTEIDALNPL